MGMCCVWDQTPRSLAIDVLAVTKHFQTQVNGSALPVNSF
jgi:hypothetical protein